MENSLKGLLLAGATVITCIILGLGFYIAREAKSTASSGAEQINRLHAEFIEGDKVLYDGVQVSGSEVIHAIHKFQNEDLCIQVSTKKGGIVSYGYTDTTLSTKSSHTWKETQNIKGTYYINPTALFQGEVVRDDNFAIVGLVFKQQ
ncbi:MAG: hypothetical protein IAC13_05855 [Firmicutes bacterium]|uniref:Uncharacterized protein n=1 Tax=Candidatus Scybalomonas excrementavium TaxID=2840943 RepID=A0A9D9I004_9FIRM|nr:hypothetical protein [Candidatus Scybalomonas excrementavium]